MVVARLVKDVCLAASMLVAREARATGSKKVHGISGSTDLRATSEKPWGLVWGKHTVLLETRIVLEAHQ